MISTRFALRLAPLLGLLQAVTALPAYVVKRQDGLLEEYDYIVAGAGTAGLTLADRLSERGNHTVLVIEYGYLDSSHSITTIAFPDTQLGIEDEYPEETRYFNLSSSPQAELDNPQGGPTLGCVVGGSSAVNGMVMDRGTAEDYDAWVEAAGDEHREEFAREWGWDNMLPWFKKSVTFHPPSERLVEEYNITSDPEAAYGGKGPIHASFAPFQWEGQGAMWNALKTVPGVEFPVEAADGNSVGVFWMPNARNPETQTRSYAKIGHYDNGASARPNFHLLPAHRVTKVLLGGEEGKLEARGVVYTPRDGDMPKKPWTVKAKKEVILSAGCMHTPQILQRSGIGPKEVLEAAGVEVKEELPGVGWNYQDHMGFRMIFDFPKSTFPNISALLDNPKFAADALEAWKTNKTGPYTWGINAAAFLPLSVISNRTEEIVTSLEQQDAADHLPKGTHPHLIAGFAEQKKVLAKQLRSTGSAVLEMPFLGEEYLTVVFLKMLSRGTVYLSPEDDGDARGNVEPVIDFRSFSNPVDLEMNVEILKWVKGFMTGEAMTETFGTEMLVPNPAAVEDDAGIKKFLRSDINSTWSHPVGTAAIAPRELGGVVGPDLTVYGIAKLSIADNSVMTTVPGTHTGSTAYAIGEKASDLVLKRAANKTT